MRLALDSSTERSADCRVLDGRLPLSGLSWRPSGRSRDSRSLLLLPRSRPDLPAGEMAGRDPEGLSCSDLLPWLAAYSLSRARLSDAALACVCPAL